MVSSGAVNGDASSLQGYLNSYKSAISELDGTWKGPSHDSIVSQADSFVSEYKGIVNQMNSFANACGEYERYVYLKNQISQTEAAQANASDDKKYGYQSVLNDLRRDLSDSKDKINSYLSEASSLSLTASAVGNVSFDGESVSTSDSSNGSSANSTKNKELIDKLMDEVGNTIYDYQGLGFHDGEWCADFVSEMLVSNGYNITKSSLAGDGENTILGSLRDSGAEVHLDIGSWAHGIDESDPEYDPDYSPQAGDVVVFDWKLDGVNDHTGFVVEDNGDGTITTLEGNTNGDAGGSCVAIKNRDRSEIYGYATPIYTGEDD